MNRNALSLEVIQDAKYRAYREKLTLLMTRCQNELLM